MNLESRACVYCECLLLLLLAGDTVCVNKKRGHVCTKYLYCSTDPIREGVTEQRVTENERDV